ncbi:hypothetical protein J3F83DRAFT_348701 [Trichoderma novae-zelandiae]
MRAKPVSSAGQGKAGQGRQAGKQQAEEGRMCWANLAGEWRRSGCLCAVPWRWIPVRSFVTELVDFSRFFSPPACLALSLAGDGDDTTLILALVSTMPVIDFFPVRVPPCHQADLIPLLFSSLLFSILLLLLLLLPLPSVLSSPARLLSVSLSDQFSHLHLLPPHYFPICTPTCSCLSTPLRPSPASSIRGNCGLGCFIKTGRCGWVSSACQKVGATGSHGWQKDATVFFSLSRCFFSLPAKALVV